MTPNDGLLEVLRCPSSGGALRVVTDPEGGVIALKSESDGKCYPVKDGIPRFVPESNYADNFGMQWKLFSHTQLDSRSGIRLSQDRFEHATKWTADRLAGRLVLDAGCGAGRFAEIALQAGAHVIALDYSTAVDACLANLRAHPRLLVVQGDIYSLPFGPGSFDFVYSLGVLQHTPDVRRAFMSLPRMLKPGGEICVDYYERWWGSALLPKY
jgi:SAM-dependent methyltransferase